MDDHFLIEHLKKCGKDIFSSGEMNEALIILYNIIWKAIQTQADKLVLSSETIRWMRMEDIIGEFRIGKIHPDASFPELLEMIRSRDTIVNKILQPSVCNDSQVIYILPEINK